MECSWGGSHTAFQTERPLFLCPDTEHSLLESLRTADALVREGKASGPTLRMEERGGGRRGVEERGGEEARRWAGRVGWLTGYVPPIVTTHMVLTGARDRYEQLPRRRGAACVRAVRAALADATFGLSGALQPT